MKKILSIVSLLLLYLVGFSQIPDGYYTTATGKSGEELKTALYNIIKGHTERTYSNL